MSIAASKTPENNVNHDDLANAIRFLSIDAVEAANSGHPGMPMGMADIATVLFQQFLKFDPQNPNWPNRDRFVLSNGHGSMLLYSLLYLTGYQDMQLQDLKDFRKLGSKTAGHPEFGYASGIETTTGPLGQGLANAVGMAMAERMMQARFGKDLVDHYTYVFTGDGCLMEGISQEAISMAGHLKLSKLIVLFDDNDISIDGPTSLSTSEDHIKRFEAARWDTQQIDGHDPKAIAAAIAKAQKTNTPSLIACKTTIGFGSPNKAGTSGSHGAALGADEVKATREKLGWTHGAFDIPDAILNEWRTAGARGNKDYAEWQKKLDSNSQAAAFNAFINTSAVESSAAIFEELKKKWAAEKPKMATRKSSGAVLDDLLKAVPNLVGGSADLTGSVNTKASPSKPITPDDFSGNYFYYGIREHGMAAAMNGMALYGGFIPYGGTFLTFSDYCRPSIRLAALMHQRTVFVMTHDSIGLGEDGPTHQPVEHLAALRSIPNLLVLRPADAIETAEAWQIAIESKDRPTVLVLTRQGLPALRDEGSIDSNLSKRGAYILSSSSREADVTLIATGSEVSLAVAAQQKLEAEGIPTSVVSMPCMKLFDEQPLEYRQAIIPEDSLKVGIEAAVSMGWEKYIGRDGIFIGMKSFGASGPAEDVYKHFGITDDAVVESVKKRL